MPLSESSVPAVAGTARRPRVAVLYKSLPQYRRRFFELLRERLDERGVEFVLVYGLPGKADRAKKDTVELPWARRIDNRIVRVAGRELYWQPAVGILGGVDLVIVEQASKLLVNYLLQLRYVLGGPKFAFWGHGRNFQAWKGSKLGEAIKRRVSRKAHWWFAYNETSAAVVKELGFPRERITLVQNAIDTRELVRFREALDPATVEQLRASLGMVGRNVGIYAGGMYREKRLPFLIDALERVRARVPDFEMIFIGAGVDAPVVQEAAARHSWIKYVGPKFDAEKVAYFAMSKLFLMPGLVGLNVLDTFALGTPLVTTDVPYHSPEIEYLHDGESGVIVKQADDAQAYADVVATLLTDDAARARLVEGCRRMQERYTVEAMAENFADGVMKALAS